MTTKDPYRVVIVGMGKRGMHHAATFHANPRFKVAGICDIDKSRLDTAASALGNPKTDTDASKLAESCRPDVFCFCTLPALRMEMIRVGIGSGAKLIAFEKPIAMSSMEAMEIRKALTDAKVKAVISHQHRYGNHYRQVKEIIDRGTIGRIHTVYGTATGWMMHMLTHLIDYMSWYNGETRADWVMAQAAGSNKMGDVHKSPDYLGGFIQYSNGVRGIVEVGAGAPDVPEVDYWWRKCRIGAMGTNGFAEVLTGGGWRAVTTTGSSSGEGCMNYEKDMPPYIDEIADWLDDASRVHQCGFESAYDGFEIAMGLCRSVVHGGQTALPLTDGADELKELQAKLGDTRVMVSSPANAKEYGV